MTLTDATPIYLGATAATVPMSSIQWFICKQLCFVKKPRASHALYFNQDVTVLGFACLDKIIPFHSSGNGILAICKF